jgi:hypothetical protein
MLFVTLGLLLGLVGLLWCFVLALTFADGDVGEGTGFHMRLSPTSLGDRPTGRVRPFTDHHGANLLSE